MKSARAILILPEGPYRLRPLAVQGLQEMREDPICIAAVEDSLAEPMVVVLHWQTTYTLRLNAAGQTSLHICSSTYVLRRPCAMFILKCKLELSIVLVWIDCHHTPEVREQNLLWPWCLIYTIFA